MKFSYMFKDGLRECENISLSWKFTFVLSILSLLYFLILQFSLKGVFFTDPK